MPDLVTVAFLLVIVALLGILVALNLRRRRGRTEPGDQLTRALQDSGLLQQVGRVEQIAAEMTSAGMELRNLFRLRPERGAAGEFQLEALLGDLLPPGRFAIRRNVAQVGTPDACVTTRDGLLMIDAKFPLDAYRDLATRDGDPAAARRRFSAAVRGHVEAVASKYVRPEVGTLPFAVLFIPSEAVFAAALDGEPSILSQASRRGVLLASPTTLAAHLSILAAGIRAEELSRSATRVRAALGALERRLGELRADWETLTRHVANAGGKVPDVARRLDAVEEAWRAALWRDDEPTGA